MRHGTIKASKESFLDSCMVFEFNVINVLSPNHLDCQHGRHGFNRIQNQLMCFNAVGGLQTCETGFWPHISKLRLLRRQNFLRIFSPSVPLGSACGLASGHGSRGKTPLHLAAENGHDSVVQSLVEAKAAVDAKNNNGRGLGRGFGGKNLLRQWDHCEESEKWMKC